MTIEQWVGLALLIVTPIVAFWLLWREVRISWALNRRGIRTDGHVDRVRQLPAGEGGAISSSTISFTDAAGTRWSFERQGDDGEGSDVRVIYDPEEPTVARITERPLHREQRWLLQQTFMSVGGAIIVLVLMLAGWHLWTGEWTWFDSPEEAGLLELVTTSCEDLPALTDAADETTRFAAWFEYFRRCANCDELRATVDPMAEYFLEERCRPWRGSLP